MSAAKFRYDGSDLSISAALLNVDANRTIAPLKLIDKLDVINKDDIYLPYSFKSSGGYKLGDTFTITYSDQDYKYRVAGFFEATMLSMNNMGMIKFYLQGEAYRQLSEKLGTQVDGTIMSTIFMDSHNLPSCLSITEINSRNPMRGCLPRFLGQMTLRW